MNYNSLKKFEDRIRLRACGLCFQDDGILLINHHGLYNHDFWAPPGGAVEFGETIIHALEREFEEECQSVITIGDFLFGCEFVRPPLHAIELYYEVKLHSLPRLGHDPEMGRAQIISGVKFMGIQELQEKRPEHLHGIFTKSRDPSAIRLLKGFFTIT